MSSEIVWCVLDYETFSELNLKKAGAYEYSKHPSTEILCAAFRIGTKAELPHAETQLWVPSKREKHFKDLLNALRNPAVQLVAQNSLFEQVITANVFGPKHMPSKTELQEIPLERWHCTASMSRAKGFPGNLEDACKALALPHQKDMEGHRVMLKLCKPRKPSKNDQRTRWTDPEDYKALYEYCPRDVDAEVDLFLTLGELGKIERKFWLIDQKMNHRGFAVDRKLVNNVLPLIDKETKRLDKMTFKQSRGKLKSVRQVEATVKFLRKEGVKIPDLTAQTVREILRAGGISDRARTILETRQSTSRSSTAKYKLFELRSRVDGRARDNTIYYGAHTGRQSGTGLQPQNLFKSILHQDDVNLGVELIRRADRLSIEALFPRPMELYASVLRSSIIAALGHTLDVGDFSTIEVRVLFWLAGYTKGLQALEAGRDLYIEMASRIHGVKVDKIVKGRLKGLKKFNLMRELGKQTVLGAGFGIGVNGEKFQATCKKYDIHISLDLAQRAIRAYRALHTPIPIFWGNIERAACLAVQKPGKTFKIGFLKWKYENKGLPFLMCRLPIGRTLYYFNPKITKKQTPWGMVPQLSYMGVTSPGKKWLRISTWGGKLAENVTQAVARDVLMCALVRLEEKKESLPVLGVHDEGVCERKIGVGSHENFLKTFGEVPRWAMGLPIKVEAWSEPRYRK